MHRNHALWLGIPILFLVVFVLLQSWAPGRLTGAVFLGILIATLVIIFLLRYKKTFLD